jgi:transposase-like protein
VSPMLGFKSFFNARRVLAGVELVHKIIKGQFGLPESLGTDPFHVWYNVLAA